MDYSGDDFYDDEVTSGPVPSYPVPAPVRRTIDAEDDGRYDDDPSPYDGTYSEE